MPIVQVEMLSPRFGTQPDRRGLCKERDPQIYATRCPAQRTATQVRWGPSNGETCLGPHTATCVAFVHHLPVSGFAVASAGVGRLRSLSSVRATAELCWVLDRPTRQSPEAVSQGPEGSPVLLSGLGSAVTAKLPVSCECYF